LDFLFMMTKAANAGMSASSLHVIHEVVKYFCT